ncbi:MAG: helix-turn-helix transcriptional regulator [Clostridia bacterium]|nr:helix-turn-helix transcriptional regulator [Clostridia bacterium]
MYLKRVKELRESRNLTQNDVCKVIGIQQPQYNRYETGKRDFPLHYIIDVALLFNTSVDYILELSDNSKPYKRIKTLENKDYLVKKINNKTNK